MGDGMGRLPRAAQLCLMLVMGLLAPLMCLPRRAAADPIDDSITELRRSRSYKVRLSAALFLARGGEPRAIHALIRALERDADSIVRRVAALSLARAVARGATADARRDAIEAVEQASRRDPDRRVRRSARRALDRMRTRPGGAIRQARAGAASLAPDSSAAAGRVFVHVGRPADSSRALPSGSGDTLLQAVRGSLRQHAPEYLMTTGSVPTRAELESRGLRGFTVNAHVARVAVENVGDHADVSCTVSLRVGPWSGSDGNEVLAAHVSASATGNGRISASRNGARRAAVDCAVAVAEELAANKVVPFLRRVAATQGR